MQQITVAIRYRINVSSFLLVDLYNTTAFTNDALTGRLQIVPFNGKSINLLLADGKNVGNQPLSGRCARFIWT